MFPTTFKQVLLICAIAIALGVTLAVSTAQSVPAEANQGWIWNDEDGNAVNVGGTGGMLDIDPNTLFLGVYIW